MKVKKIVTAAMCLCMIAQTAGYVPVFRTDAANGNVVVEQPVKVQIHDIFQYKNLGNYIEIVATATNATGVVEVPSEIDGLPVKTAAEHAFAGNQNVTEFKLPDTLTSIGKGAFQGDTALTSITIPKGVTQIKDETFLNCMSLSNVFLPDTVTSIGVRAFYNCNQMISFKMPTNVKSIGAQAFDSCRQLRDITIPNGVTVLEMGVFFNCDALYYLDVPASVEKICQNAVSSATTQVTIYNPDCEIELFAISSKNTTIKALANSKVHAFANEYGINFKAFTGTIADEDINADGKFSVADVVTLNNWLMGKGTIADGMGDINHDGYVDVFDLCLMKKALVESLEFNPPALASLVNLTADIQSAEVEGKSADEAFVNGQTKFALEFFQNTITDDSNVLISPYSMVQALAMTANGADGVTKEEMENVIGGGIDIDELNRYLYTQRNSQPDDEKCKLLTANSVWTREKRINVYPEFLQKVVDYYSAEVFKAPFDDSTVKDINNWVDTNTDHMIPEVIQEISDDTLMYLINAVTFDAQWKNGYDEDDIVKYKFTNYNGDIQEADMMMSEEMNYISDENAEGFYKYYDGGRYAFAALLPNEDISVVDYVNSLTPESLNNILATPKRQDITVGIPKFSYAYSSEEGQLVDVFSDMGMPSPFYYADFSKMASNDLFISEIIHKTFIDVSEKGTKAAAASVVAVAECAAVPVEPKEVILDRPFVYFIVDTATYQPVFMGTLMSIE